MQRSTFKQLLITFLAIALPIAPLTLMASSDSIIVQAETVDADRLFEQGTQHYQAGQFETAVKLWQQARLLYQQQHNIAGESSALETLGSAYVQRAQYRNAIAALEACWLLARSLNHPEQEAKVVSNLGIAYQALGHYAKAIQLHKLSARLMQKLGDRQKLGQSLLNLGTAFEAVGDYDRALIVFQQSLKLAYRSDDAIGAGLALENLGAIYANLGDDNKAIAAYEQSLQIHQRLHNRNGQTSALLNLGSTYHTRKQLAKATHYYQQALELAKATGDRRREAEVMGSLGLVAEDQQQYATAIADFRQSLALLRSLGDPAAQAVALNNLGHALLNHGNLMEAETMLRQAIQRFDALRPDLNDQYQVSIFDTQVHTYNLLQQVLVAANKPAAALVASEQSRARAFANFLSKRLSARADLPAAKQFNYTSINEVQQLRSIAQQHNATLVEYSLVPDDDFKFRGKLTAPASQIFIWVVKPTGEISFRQVDLKSLNLSLGDLITQGRRAIGVNGRAGAKLDRPPPTAQTHQLQQLYNLLIAPIHDLLPSDANDRVIFVPQDALFQIPFPALQDQSGKYLIETHVILTTPSIQILQLTQQQRQRLQQQTRPANPLIVGNPTMPLVTTRIGAPPEQLPALPGAERESHAIAQVLNADAITGSRATKAAIVPQMAQATVIHFATHGLLDDATGLGVPGAIALAPSTPTQPNDGLLTADDLLNMDLTAELVVLSACDTGQGRITGDGVVGLSRSLVLAGVPSVIVSLWSVSDAPTAELMIEFYRNWQRTRDKAQALRQAMLTTLKLHPDPIDWAAFTLIGES